MVYANANAHYNQSYSRPGQAESGETRSWTSCPTPTWTLSSSSETSSFSTSSPRTWTRSGLTNKKYNVHIKNICCIHQVGLRELISELHMALRPAYSNAPTLKASSKNNSAMEWLLAELLESPFNDLQCVWKILFSLIMYQKMESFIFWIINIQISTKPVSVLVNLYRHLQRSFCPFLSPFWRSFQEKTFFLSLLFHSSSTLCLISEKEKSVLGKKFPISPSLSFT